MDLKEKIEILADSAKYDVSCSSSGSNRSSSKYSMGNSAPAGICHSFSEDGRCISLLKILLTNHCIYDCHYCINRSSNDIRRAFFTVDEICSLTVNFYKRNYIEGLFLSSGVIKSPDFTMELIYNVVKKLREEFGFGGYIHTKAIPGADRRLVDLTGLYVDRMSINIELPSKENFSILAPQKNPLTILSTMKNIKYGIENYKENMPLVKRGDRYVPGGQSTQLIVGATKDTDGKIIKLSQNMYERYSLKRVYYSAYTPVNHIKTLPDILYPPLLREHRIYQADWLLRFYNFKAEELLSEEENFDENIDPKCQWALSNLDKFPLEINKASYEMLLRVPGIGVTGANRIVRARRISSLNYDDIKRMGIVLKRARHFITVKGKYYSETSFDKDRIYAHISEGKAHHQISFFDEENINKTGLSLNRNSLFTEGAKRILKDPSLLSLYKSEKDIIKANVIYHREREIVRNDMLSFGGGNL